ncbi:uncharacterized protein MELLADRAFT_107988 [Melampsora larici-populina 98AG31]|uniref:Secreted protein n=1 Tax=Melampsora larici-populina (strain 98AG31 / pathotype 3-4-7) TaxID=747676 RepID=F4RRL4_MELLP|nr:uncharacterized protein MELLADRAFT_107988 [Melampsora larici-populina 98AG31]EGG05002.1 secreted protein [Melampsora larici-populina 98AG31]
MSPIYQFLMIYLTIFFTFLATLASTKTCEVCMYDGTVYRDPNGGIAAPNFCQAKATEMTLASQRISSTDGACHDMGWYTHFSDSHGQKTYCRFRCQRDTDCIGEKTSIRDSSGRKVPHNAFLGRRDMECNEWPGN